MLIIKPYGTSVAEAAQANGNRRMLRLRDRPSQSVDIEEFALSHDELVIAQWISVIDKIARKPAAGRGATAEQRTLRAKLGEAAWARLIEGGRLPGASDPARFDHLLALWNWKIAPYGSAQYESQPRRPPPSAKGKWFDRFSPGIANVAAADHDSIAQRIEQHLYANESVTAGARTKRHGLIAGRARSIATNVLQPPVPAYDGGCGDGWTAEDEGSYATAGDVALRIRRLAEQREQGKDPSKRRQVSRDVAAMALYDHYARLFIGDDGQVLGISEARTRFPSLFSLHEAVKDSYARILARKPYARPKDALLAGQRRPLSTLLPETMEDLFALVDAKGLNRDLNALVRLGKVIHYEAAKGGPDSPEAAVGNWPADPNRSEFWTSQGQLEIKRNEAFVRIWRRVLGLAGRTLTDWADSKGAIGGDILLFKPKERAIGDEFDAGVHARKLDLLLGRRAEIFKFADEGEQRALLKFGLDGVSRLRHSAFHFTGYAGFARSIAASCRDASPAIHEALERLWMLDWTERRRQAVTIARGAQFDRFWPEEDAQRLVDAAAAPETTPLALPRLSRVLKRARDAFGTTDAKAGLLSMPSVQELRDGATFCRYEALKLLYDAPFRHWLFTRGASELNGFIDAAVGRSSEAAQSLNSHGDASVAELIVARASKLGRLGPGENIADFFFRLSAASASELRVQRGYQSDSARARAQSDYIEKLKLDVVALAFGEFLVAAEFAFVLALDPGAIPDEGPAYELRGPVEATGEAPEDWQLGLYFLLHLVPVDDVVRLLHQVQRWEGHRIATAISPMEPTLQLQAVLSLYCDMHDAKFEGGAGLSAVEPFRHLYQNPADFDRVFPVLGPAELRTCRRGLREIVRFGHIPPLRRAFEAQGIGAGDVEQFLAANMPDGEGGTAISRLQAERESLHASWVAKGREFERGERDRYQAVLGQVVRYRHLAAHVTLTNHVRIHRLLVACWSRLVDFSGLWERDLYFVTLALIQLEKKTPREALGSKGAYFLARGQIIEALRKATLSPFIANVLSAHFTSVWKKDSRAVKIRNKVAHFNMLRHGSAPDLTHGANEMRELLRHDRKLRNAVPKSIKELLRQNGLEIEWRLEAERHDLGACQLTTRQAVHLRNRSITEDLHGDGFVAMAAALFGDCRPVRPAPREKREYGRPAPGRRERAPARTDAANRRLS